MEEKKNTLIKLGFNINSIGFDYWLYAIKLYNQYRGKYTFSMEILYQDISKYFKTTRNRVERTMRTASIHAKENIKKIYKYNNKITNKTILILLTRFDEQKEEL